ncbi:MAG: ATP-binding protein [Phycisphaeraceae bacterium]|nr:ATP-binding protein [Phycisphaeraceae bacterium]
MSEAERATTVEPDVQVELFSQPRFLTGIRGLVTQLARRLGFEEGAAGKISLALDEAICNVINHGYDRRPDGRIWIRIWALEAPRPGLRIVVEDRARMVDPAKIRSRDLDDIRPGGLGVHIIREVMDDVVYEQRDGGGMRLTLVKHLADAVADGKKADS